MPVKKPKKKREPRRTTIGFEKHSHLPAAIVDHKFIAAAGSMVWTWRLRSGMKPSWYPCKVVTVEEKHVSLWDEVAGQWFCFDPTAENIPDVRISA